MRARLDRITRSPNLVATLTTVLALGALLLVWWLGSRWYQSRLLAEQRVRVSAEVALTINSLALAIERRFAPLDALSAFARAEIDDGPDGARFEAFAADLHTRSPQVRSLSIAPQGVIRFVYPPNGNESLLGYEPAQDPRADMRADALRALESGQVVVTGPIELVQGGTGLIARRAVHAHDGRVWGLVNVAVDLTPILAEAGLMSPPGGLQVAVRDETGQNVFGPGEIWSQDPVVRSVLLPEGTWQLAGLPAGGWAAAIEAPLVEYQGTTLLITGLVAALLFAFTQRQVRLESMVRERTRDITRINTQLAHDLAERQRVENELRLSEERYRTLTRNFPNGAVILFDHDLRYVLGDGAGLAEVGLSKELLEGRTIWEIFSPEVAAVLEPRYRAALAGTPSTFEVPFADRIYLLHVLPIHDEHGAISGGLAMTQNITDRKRVDAELQASEARFRSLVEISPVGVILSDPAGNFRYVSPSYEHNAGYTAEELIGRPVFCVVHPDDVATVIEEFSYLIQHPDYIARAEYRHVRKDGSLRIIEANGRVLPNGDVVGYIQDVTERKQAEQQLAEKEEQYRSIFEATTDGMFINAFNGQLVDFNPAAAHMHGYTVEEFRALQPPQFIHADSLLVFDQSMDAVQAGRTFRGNAVDVRKDGTLMPVDVLSTSFTYRGQAHSLAVVRDITEQVQAYELLEQRVEERTRELSTLLSVSRHLTSTLEIDAVLGQFLESLGNIIDYNHATLGALEGETMRLRAYRGACPPAEVPALLYIAPNSLDQQVIATRRPLLIADVEADTPEACAFRAGHSTPFLSRLADMRCHLRVPLIVKDRVAGVLTLHHPQPGRYAAHDVELALAFADQAAAALENARLFEASQRRAEQFRVIGEMGYRITSILAVDELLAQTVRLIRETFGYHHIHIGLIQEGHVLFKREAGLWCFEGTCVRCEALTVGVGAGTVLGEVAKSGEPILVPDVAVDPRFTPLAPDVNGSELVLPLKVKGRIIGVLNLESEQVNGFDAGDVTVLQSFANQAAVAIENARLYEQSQQLAALEERQKLARELHDSVSQALYGIALGARTARTQLDREPSQVIEPLDYVLSLSEAALAEMRALIFELRPESLETEGLAVALEKQAASLRARHHFDVQLTLAEEPRAPLEVKQALYRIAQEALHNVVKHARASQVALVLAQTEAGLTLEVRDNGRGFETGRAFPGHLGLKSMRERAERLGGVFQVASAPGVGAHICVHIPHPAR